MLDLWSWLVGGVNLYELRERVLDEIDRASLDSTHPGALDALYREVFVHRRSNADPGMCSRCAWIDTLGSWVWPCPTITNAAVKIGLTVDSPAQMKFDWDRIGWHQIG